MAFEIPLELFFFYVQIRNYLSAGSYAVLIYDWFLTFDDELTLVWKRRPGLPKPTRSKATTCFFVAARYLPFAAGSFFAWDFLYSSRPALNRNPLIATIYNYLLLLSIAACEGILLARTYGIWICSRKMLYFLVGLYTTIVLACVGILLPGIAGVKIHGTSLNFIAYILIAVIETIVIVLTMYRGFLDYRAVTGSGEVPLVLAFSRAMYRDGLQYYLCIFSLSIANLVLQLTIKGSPAFLADMQLVTHSVLSCRVVLRLRRMTYDLSNELGHNDIGRQYGTSGTEDIELVESDPVFDPGTQRFVPIPLSESDAGADKRQGESSKGARYTGMKRYKVSHEIAKGRSRVFEGMKNGARETVTV